jgi:hypothetical protein
MGKIFCLHLILLWNFFKCGAEITEGHEWNFFWNLQLKFWCKPNYERLLRSRFIDEEIDHCDAIGHKNINCPILVWDFKYGA